MNRFRNLFSAGVFAAVLFGFLFFGTCKKEEKNDDTTNAIFLLLAGQQPYVEQSKTGFFIIVPKGIAQ
ncbi:hypothetical protein EHQ12_02935 [Leptospira gomenensis]|uniref:Uncharacterized protein n=1 Tax=Leptospira gomenensis TaxID=2484974 RepID=A0A5F1Y7T4_9LEPT|nr:hypothetical protein [Leptospira gomenensis]TGK31016.1 hypothetical protein EHQ17_14970 [Leptospira gomenensis]TGK43222.1 hypothetical protein EHQ12_02935 [Leptospira gomenensis]TGK45264.1 hypothetical protein EHQ07_10030 [Leptospira gomenensis]TGK66178.1 hypothetical protein EHQ13_03765 [Leptospira gomenensis]